MHRGHLINMLTVTDMGAVVLPPVPGFYSNPQSLEDIVHHTVGKVLDILDLEHHLFQRWQGDDGKE